MIDHHDHTPHRTDPHDSKDKKLGHAIPYGVLDLTRDEGWVNVGIDTNTAQFAAASIQVWWEHLGQQRYQATTLTITADCGGSNGNRLRLWKAELQRLADDTGLSIEVCHFPPGTSKWNKIEHRLFSFISQNWRGKPLISHEVLINLIAATSIHGASATPYRSTVAPGNKAGPDWCCHTAPSSKRLGCTVMQSRYFSHVPRHRRREGPS